MSEPVKPAMTAEEWAKAEKRGILSRAHAPGSANWEIANDFPHFCEGDSRHALAAISLHGQPFGFTREDVALLKGVALAIPRTTHRDFLALTNLAARIEALLPPEVAP